MRPYKTEAVVLREWDFGEADKILILYAPNRGKIHAIAKGVRKPRSRMRGGVQLFCHADFFLYQGKSLDTITQVVLKEAFRNIRGDLDKLAHASYLVELLESVATEKPGNPELFGLLLAGLHLLTGDDPDLAVRFFEVRLLELWGYQPRLTGCVQCGVERVAESWCFSMSFGGLLCPHCQGGDTSALKIAPDVLAVWRSLSKTELTKLFRLKVTRSTRTQLAEILQLYYRHHLEKDLKTVAFIRQLKSY